MTFGGSFLCCTVGVHDLINKPCTVIAVGTRRRITRRHAFLIGVHCTLHGNVLRCTKPVRRRDCERQALAVVGFLWFIQVCPAVLPLIVGSWVRFCWTM